MINKYKEKCIGTLLGTAVGDILGAGIEGLSKKAILKRYGEVKDFLHTGRGFGCYTDDTEMTLALAQSIIRCNGVYAEDCARSYARFYNPWRGYGAGAHAVMNALNQGADFKETGYLLFKDGSFGNGGAMRIAPVGLAYYKKDDKKLKKAVFDAVRCTHIHPEGIDGALVQAKAIAILTSIEKTTDFEPVDFLDELSKISDTKIMKEKILYLEDVLKKDICIETAIGYIGNGIHASEAVTCALLATIKYHSMPEEAVIKSINFGGDTDTIGAMTGAQMGALYGKDWLPARWMNHMENGKYGRDYIIKLASDMASRLKMTTHTSGVEASVT